MDTMSTGTMSLHIYVLEDIAMGKIIGTITLLIEPKLIRNFGKVGHIEDVIIDAEYRGQGLGRVMIAHMIEASRNNRCYKCILNCSTGNEAFYQKCGFETKGLEMSMYFDVKS